MRRRDTFDVLASCLAVAADAAAVFLGFMLAIWVRFGSGWVPLVRDTAPDHLYRLYAQGAAAGTLLFLFVFRALGLYVRPQAGAFGDRIPRLAHAVLASLLGVAALAFVWRTEPPFSRVTLLLSGATVLLLVLVERAALFRWEVRAARRRRDVRRVAMAGTDALAARLKASLEQEPRLGARAVAFFRTRADPVHPGIPADLVRGAIEDLRPWIEQRRVDEVILTDSAIDRARMEDLMLLCERSLVTFTLVPDLLYMMTGSVDLKTVSGIPLLGVTRWPLDRFWNRVLKRTADLAGAAVGLLLAAPVMAVCAWLIRRDAPGPVLYRQVRCGEGGRPFTLYKFRTMVADAEARSGPVWAVADDPRRTRVGAVLRRYGLDELPQLWNVLRGDMSLVGPRPERPCFVEQFKEELSRYMWRHASRPGLTGWAQVSGLRGNTDLRERLRCDLYYLEHWSLAFDFKILLQTLVRRDNAY